MKIEDFDRHCMERAVALALATEEKGNVPVGAVITLNDTIIAEGANEMFAPEYHPGKHAERQALDAVPSELWPQVHEMVCYSTLEPCPMCMGSLLIYEFKRIVYGSRDELGGATTILDQLPRYFTEDKMPIIEGPRYPELCDPLATRVIDHFRS